MILERQREMLEKYSQEVTAKEMLEMYEDPEAFFSDKERKASELYKKHSMAHLKKAFPYAGAAIIGKVFAENGGLYYPCYKVLSGRRGQMPANRRKTRRAEHECAPPAEIELNFLKELQFSRIEGDVRAHLEREEKEKTRRVEEARKMDLLETCNCCYNDECLPDDMLPCKGGHSFCIDCIRRASQVRKLLKKL